MKKGPQFETKHDHKRNERKRNTKTGVERSEKVQAAMLECCVACACELRTQVRPSTASSKSGVLSCRVGVSCGVCVVGSGGVFTSFSTPPRRRPSSD